MRIKIIKTTTLHKKGDVVEVSPNVGFGLIDSGVGIITKDIVPDDYKQAGDKNGKSTQLRSDKRK